MSKYTSFRAGGRAALLIEADDVGELREMLQAVTAAGVPHMILGNGSNTLFRDSGYDGVVIKLGEGFANVALDGDDSDGACDGGEQAAAGKKLVTCGTAVLLSSLARTLLDNSLTGFEFASGIPGSLGGALFMNAGAYGGEMKQVVRSVRAVSSDGSEERIFTDEEMQFGYRHSVLETNGYIAVSVVLEFERGDRDEIAETMRELASKRNSKQPVQYPSAGSTFKRPEGYFAGKLIEDAGLKGVTVGGAQVSTLHSGFIINRGGATATDIIELITLVQNRVYDEFGVMLQPEVRIIG